MSLLANRLRQESGFTLVEMLVTMLIGIVVFGAALGLTEVSGRASQRTTDRVETAQRARVAMDRMVRQLRSQVCLDSVTYPIVAANDDSITFYADFDNTPVYRPQKRKLTFDPLGTGKIVEERYDSTTTTGPPWSFPTTATRTFTVVSNVGRIGGTTPIFRYYSPAGTLLGTPLSTNTTSSPLPANSIARVSLIEIAFQTLPSSGNTDTTRRAERDSRVYVRSSDSQGPVCG